MGTNSVTSGVNSVTTAGVMDPISEIMMTPSNQYLQPEFLSPLPTTLDAKKSPLALLAQTCSQIGADNPNHKPIVASLEKSNRDSAKKSSTSSLSSLSSLSSSFSIDEKPSFKPYEVSKTTPDSTTFKSRPKSKSPRTSPATSNGKRTPSSTPESSMTSTASSTTTATTSADTTVPLFGFDPTSKEGQAALAQLNLAYRGLNPLLYPPFLGMAGHPDVLAQEWASKNFSMSPSAYSGYARVKAMTTGSSLGSACKDPLCNNCQTGMHLPQLSPCTHGCTTPCNHERVMPHLLPGLHPGVFGGFVGHPGASLFSAPAPPVARPNICSWMVGDTYCGKRFNSSEELLQHLRSHTSLASNDASNINASFQALLNNANASVAQSFGSSGVSPASLRRTYPTSISPLSLARYHPYKNSFPLPPHPAAFSHSSLNMFYSSLYGNKFSPTINP